MPQKTDLYSILRVYSSKNNMGIIDIDVFIDFLGKHAGEVYREKPEWERWIENTETKVWEDLYRLEKEGRLLVINEERSPRIFMCSYYAEPIEEAYKNLEAQDGVPFPDESFLSITIPGEQLIYLGVTTDLPGFLREAHETILPLKLIFPNHYGSAIALTSMLPLKLLECSFLKIRSYLMKHNNKDFFQHKLAPQFAAKEGSLRSIMNMIITKPTQCADDMVNGREAAFHFWLFFCNLVKNELGAKKNLLPEERAVLQSVCIVDVCGSFYRNKAAKTREVELALNIFEAELENPPYCFSKEMIAGFKDNKGVPLLGQYSPEELEAFIKKRITEASADELPELLYFRDRDETHWLIKKSKLLALCARLLVDTRQAVIKAISIRWKKILLVFRREPAMDDDREFEKLILVNVRRYVPLLTVLLEDPRLFLVHEEARSREKGIPEASRLFSGSELLPLRNLLLLRRRQLLSDVRMFLPFWYTLPVIGKIIAFFQNLGNKKKPVFEEEEPVAPRNNLQKTAFETERQLVPEGRDPDSYMAELAERWGRLLDHKELDKLVNDVNIVIRDKLRYLLRTRNDINKDTLDILTRSIIESSPGINKISDQKPLALYIKIYLAKLLQGKL